MENHKTFSITGVEVLDNNPLFLMGFVYKQFHLKVASELVKEVNISIEMYGALKVLHESGEITQQELSDLLLRHRSVMKRLVDNAIKQEYILARKSETNKKVKLLSLTEKGIHVMKVCEPIIQNVSKQVMAPLKDVESNTLRELLKDLIDLDNFIH